jgi:predicted nucleotidyltransferase
MEPHHHASINNVVDYFKQQPEAQALLLAGSLAHGFSLPTSDVDILIIVSEEDYERRLQTNDIHFFNTELCTYEGGYVDGKYVGKQFLDKVAAKGSDPARFAFKDAIILYSNVSWLEGALKAAIRYPIEEKADRLKRFYAQFEAWHWFSGEALRHNNHYLLATAVSKMVLFGGRLILTHNEMLYPFHKWFPRVLAKAPLQPTGLMEKVDAILTGPNSDSIETFFTAIKEFQPWEITPGGWPVQFVADTEWTWMDNRSAVDDL